MGWRAGSSSITSDNALEISEILDNPSFTKGGQYLQFHEAPYFSGDTDRLRMLFETATGSHRNFCILGDSQETTPNGSGSQYIIELNRLAFKRYDRPHATPWYPFGTHLSNVMWLNGTEDAATTDTGNFPLPNFRAWQSDADNIGSLATLFPDAGDSADAVDGIYFPATTGAIQWELLLQRDSTATAEECRIVQLSSAAPRSYFGTRTEQNTINTTTLSLNSEDNTFAVVNTGDLTYGGASEPWITCYARGLVSGAPAANNGMLTVGSRWIDTSRRSGMTWTSFTRGGDQITSYLSDFPNMGAAVSAFGAEAFDAVFLQFGTNDAGSSLNTPDTWRASLESLITDTRTKFGSDQFIVIVSEPPRRDYGGLDTQLTDNFNRYAAVAGSVANATENCAFLNLGRMLYEIDSDFGLPASSGGTYLTDSVHLTATAQKLAAESIYDLADKL